MTEVTNDLGLLAAPRRGTGRRLSVIILCLTLVLVAGTASLFLVRGVDSQLDDISNVYDVRRQAHELILAIVDAETGQRGFLLTQDPQYLLPYETASLTIDATYNGLLERVSGNAAQTAAIEALAEPIARKRDEMATTIQLASEGKLSAALSLIRTDEGQDLITSLRFSLRTFIAAEDAKLVERNGVVQSYRQWLVAAILAALASAVALTYVLFTRTQRQFSSLARVSSVLQSQNEELEAHVRQRTAEVEDARAHAERERARVETLLQDTNHRIGNSLATVSSLLGLQVARSKSEEVRMALDAAQARVHAIASSHRRLRLGADLETINADEFLESVLEDLRTTHAVGREVTFNGNFEPVVIHARDATTIGIVLGELITNALKHAFPNNGAGTIWASLGRNAEGVAVLCVEDDGNGLSEDVDKVDFGLGATIVKQLARQFGGQPSYEPRPGGGTRVSVTLPELERSPEARD